MADQVAQDERLGNRRHDLVALLRHTAAVLRGDDLGAAIARRLRGAVGRLDGIARPEKPGFSEKPGFERRNNGKTEALAVEM